KIITQVSIFLLMDKLIHSHSQQDTPISSWVDALAATEQARKRSSFLSRASELLAESLDLNRVLDRAARLAVPFLGDYCVVETWDKDGKRVRVAEAYSRPFSPDIRRSLQDELNRPVYENLVQRALAGKAAVYLDQEWERNLPESLRFQSFNQGVIVP